MADNTEIESLTQKLLTGGELTPAENYKLLVNSLNVIKELEEKVNEFEQRVIKTEKENAKPVSPVELVKEFHEVYGLTIRDTPELNIPERKLRVELIKEEAEEYEEAEAAGDLVEMADALGDLVYVAYGAALAHGIDLDEVLQEIQRSNLSKLHHETGKPIYREDGKVLKGQNFFNPDIARVLKEQGWNE